MRTFLLLTVLSLTLALKWNELAEAQQHTYTFEDFKAEFGRDYQSTKVEASRRELFELRLKRAVEHNRLPNQSWKKAINDLSDRTDEELKALRGLKKDHTRPFRRGHIRMPAEHYKNINISAFAGIDVDWRTKGVITGVKNQGACGSCWTFATAETIESYNALLYKQLVVLSEQQILDCTPNPNQCGGTGGCGGGTIELAVARINVMGGLSTEADYPYVSGGGQNFQCNMQQFKPRVVVNNYIDLPSNQVAPVLQHLTNTGPLAIVVDASTWSEYGSGVFDGCNNQNPDLDHAVQAVGYGTDPSYGDYWLVRNSWGANWGEYGYIRIKRYATAPCGIDTSPQDGTGCNGGPSQVTVCGNCGILYDTTYVTIK